MKMLTKVILIWIFLSLPFFFISCGGTNLAAPANSGEESADENPSESAPQPAMPASAPTNETENDAANDAAGTPNDASQSADGVNPNEAAATEPAHQNWELSVAIEDLPESATAGEAVTLTYAVTNASATTADGRVEIRIHDESLAAISAHKGHAQSRPLLRQEKFRSFCTDKHPCTTLQTTNVSLAAGETKSWTTDLILPEALNGTYHFVVRIMDVTGVKFYARDFTTIDVAVSDSTEESDTTTDDTQTEDTADEVEDETTDETIEDEVVEEETSDEPQVDLTAGANLFAVSCAGCHASDGTGASGPDLTTRIPGMSDAAIEDQIRNGGSSMPAVGSGFTEVEMVNIIAFLKTL